MDPDEKLQYISRIRCGSSPDTIMIVVQLSDDKSCYLQWNMVGDHEEDSFERENYAKIIFDQQGLPYIASEAGITICEQGVLLKSYDVENLQTTSKHLHFMFYKGHRFDHKNHNWILFSEYLSLSFSFMSLVIRGKNQNEENVEDQFDLTQYNFNINRMTFLTCDNFVCQNHDKLEVILNKLQKLDKDLLQQLHYYYTREKLPIVKSDSFFLDS